MLDLSTPIEKLAYVGPKNAPRLKRLGLKTVRDLLWHFPSRYEDFSQAVRISDIREKGQTVSVIGTVTDIKTTTAWPASRQGGRKPMTITDATIEDDSDIIHAVWFRQPYLERTLLPGTLVSLSGKVALDKKGLYLSAPSYEKLSSVDLETNDLTHTGRLVPVYPETEGVSSKYLRLLIKSALAKTTDLVDPLPKDLRAKYDFPEINSALRQIHFPEDLDQTEQARQRFAFEEIVLFQLRALRDRRQLQALKAPVINFDKELIAQAVKSLPFELTNDQRLAAFEILKDLERGFPMNRLLNGDVGSGKTVVALLAALQTASAGYQTAFLAPTEILAKQHFQTISSLIFNFQFSIFKQIPNSKSQIRIGLLTGNEVKQWPTDEITEAPPSPKATSFAEATKVKADGQSKISKKLMQQKITRGEVEIVIGTHAVIQKGVKFKNLGLVVIDEQHRFGVQQRMALLKNHESRSMNKESAFLIPNLKFLIPHLLSMTATPIPRTLALTIYGDLDVSLLKEKPKGRQEIITRVVSHNQRKSAYKFIDDQIKAGRQVFVICPRIAAPEGSEPRPKGTGNLISDKPLTQAKLVWSEIKAVTAEYEKLAKTIFPHRRVAMLHGKLKSKEKDEIMHNFKSGHYDLLVSTSVVEVGVDVPNASLMLIESAERFGLAQLHQFRGRVGRDKHQSYCLLFTSNDTETTRRLKALEQTNDGFALAETDMKIRGPGEFTGVKQSGMPDLAMTSLGDVELIKKARLEAKLLLKDDPALKSHPALLARLTEMQRLVHFE